MARDYGYIISPSLKWYDFKPGETYTDSFSITNSFVTNTPEDQTFVITTGFVFQENGTKFIYPTVPTGKNNYAMTDWITFDTQEVTIKQNDSKKITYTINVPQNPPPGGKYAAIIIQKKGVETLNGTGAQLDDQVAYQILGSIAGKETRDSEITNFTVNKQVFFLWPYEKAEFTLSFRNKGNVELVPNGDIFVHQGRITQSLWNESFNPQTLVVLPENERSYQVTWIPQTKLIKTDTNGITLNLDYFRIGKYTATAKIGTEINGQRILTEKLVTFWILPLPLIIAILTLILVTYLVNRLWRNRQSRK